MQTDALSALMIEIGERADRRGWVPAGGGNFSARLDNEQMLVTTSGNHKGRLQAEGFMRMTLGGQSLDESKRPSDEAGLHAALYRLLPEAQAVLHVHSPCVLAMAADAKAALSFSGQELLKVFEGIDTHATRMRVPVVKNDQNIPRLAEAAEQAIRECPGARAYVIRGHGLYTWAASLERAERQVEALEFLCQCELLRRPAQR